MQLDKKGVHRVKYGEVNKVHDIINNILDGENLKTMQADSNANNIHLVKQT